MTNQLENGTGHATLTRSDITVEARVVRLGTARSIPPVGMKKDRRRSSRVPVDHGIRCRYGAGETGSARVCDAGRHGVSLRSGRYLRPGTLLMLELGARPEGPTTLACNNSRHSYHWTYTDAVTAPEWKRHFPTGPIGPRRARGPAELKAKVAWCRPTPDGDEFLTGLRVYHDEPDTLGALAGLMFDGVDRLGADKHGPRSEMDGKNAGSGCGARIFLRAHIAPAVPVWQAV